MARGKEGNESRRDRQQKPSTNAPLEPPADSGAMGIMEMIEFHRESAWDVRNRRDCAALEIFSHGIDLESDDDTVKLLGTFSIILTLSN